MRRTSSTRLILAAGAGSLLLLANLPSVRAVPSPARNWYKGNLHTHTTKSDGDSPPDYVASWYKRNGYQFLALSDHNQVTDISELTASLGEDEKFLLLPAEEVTDSWRGTPIHLNGYNPWGLIQPAGGASLVNVIQNDINAIYDMGGIPALNHPNYGWAVESRQLLAIDNLKLFEVYNGHPAVNNRGGGGSESLEEMWDCLLTANRTVFGIAVDDAHHFRTPGKAYSNPGRWWFARRLSPWITFCRLL